LLRIHCINRFPIWGQVRRAGNAQLLSAIAVPLQCHCRCALRGPNNQFSGGLLKIAATYQAVTSGRQPLVGGGGAGDAKRTERGQAAAMLELEPAGEGRCGSSYLQWQYSYQRWQRQWSHLYCCLEEYGLPVGTLVGNSHHELFCCRVAPGRLFTCWKGKRPAADGQTRHGAVSPPCVAVHLLKGHKGTLVSQSTDRIRRSKHPLSPPPRSVQPRFTNRRPVPASSVSTGSCGRARLSRPHPSIRSRRLLSVRRCCGADALLCCLCVPASTTAQDHRRARASQTVAEITRPRARRRLRRRRCQSSPWCGPCEIAAAGPPS
jgi:hypothetical protein